MRGRGGPCAGAAAAPCARALGHALSFPGCDEVLPLRTRSMLLTNYAAAQVPSAGPAFGSRVASRSSLVAAEACL